MTSGPDVGIGYYSLAAPTIFHVFYSEPTHFDINEPFSSSSPFFRSLYFPPRKKKGYTPFSAVIIGVNSLQEPIAARQLMRNVTTPVHQTTGEDRFTLMTIKLNWKVVNQQELVAFFFNPI